MKHRLQRVLRVRAVLEELSRLELEERTAAVQRLERAAEQQQQRADAARAQSLGLLFSEQTDGWQTQIVDAEILAWKRGRLAALALAGQTAREEARQALLARRLDRRQIAALLDAAEEAGARERGRREQHQLDDWFHSRAYRKPHTPK